MVGLAPPRDFKEEEAVYDANLVETIQIQLEEKHALIEELQNHVAILEAEKERLSTMLIEKSELKSKACAELAAKQELLEEYKGKVSRRDALIKHRNIAVVVLAGLLVIAFAVHLFGCV